MARLDGTYTRTFVVAADLEATKRHFSELEAIAAATDGVVRHAIDGDVLHLVLKTQNHGVTTFTPDYRVRYTVAGDVVRWATVAGNTVQSGEARLRATAGGTEVAYTETVAIEVPVPTLMVPMLRPVVRRIVTAEVASYVERMLKSL